MNVTVGQLADWIMEHRKGEAFKDFTWEQVAETVEESSAVGGLVFAVDVSNGQIVGACCGEVDDKNKIYHAANIVTIKPWAVAVMILKYKELFPEYSMRVCRKGKDRILKSVGILDRIVRKQIPINN